MHERDKKEEEGEEKRNDDPFGVDDSLRHILDELGVIHEEIMVKDDGYILAYFVFDSKYLNFKTLENLKQTTDCSEIRIYPQSYSKFIDSGTNHTGVILCTKKSA